MCLVWAVPEIEITVTSDYQCRRFYFIYGDVSSKATRIWVLYIWYHFLLRTTPHVESSFNYKRQVACAYIHWLGTPTFVLMHTTLCKISGYFTCTYSTNCKGWGSFVSKRILAIWNSCGFLCLFSNWLFLNLQLSTQVPNLEHMQLCGPFQNSILKQWLEWCSSGKREWPQDLQGKRNPSHRKPKSRRPVGACPKFNPLFYCGHKHCWLGANMAGSGIPEITWHQNHFVLAAFHYHNPVLKLACVSSEAARNLLMCICIGLNTSYIAP